MACNMVTADSTSDRRNGQRSLHQQRRDALEKFCDGAVVGVDEAFSSEPDYDRLESAALQMLSAARRGQDADRILNGGFDD